MFVMIYSNVFFSRIRNDATTKEKRILLTLDKDFEDDTEFKLSNTFGVIILSIPSPAVPESFRKVTKKLVNFLNAKRFEFLAHWLFWKAKHSVFLKLPE